MEFFCRFGNNSCMKRKEYVFKMANLIRNRVLYHAPIKYTGDVDFQRIINRGIDLSLPIFVFEKEMKKEMLLSFIEAQKQTRFNLIIDRCDRVAMKKIKNCFWIEGELLQQLKKLDINYKSTSPYKIHQEEDFIKVQGEKIAFAEKDFMMDYKGMSGKVLCKIKKYLLSGLCMQIDVINTSNSIEDFSFEYNQNLPHGYYSFELLKKGVKIGNLITNEEMFLNINTQPQFSNFSCVDGVESSAFAKINFCIIKRLAPFEKRSFFINFGKHEFSLNNQSEMEYFYALSQKKNMEIFDVKIESKNKFFERSFNRYLPQKIWQSWLDGKRDENSEDEYNLIKNSIVRKEKNKYIFLKNSYPITSISCFDGNAYKKIEECL